MLELQPSMHSPSAPGSVRDISILYVGGIPESEEAATLELLREKILNRVETAVDSRHALGRIRAGDQAVDLVLLDEAQANADGWMLLKEMAALPPDRRPAVVVVAGEEKVDVPQVRDLGAAGRLVRPLRGDALARIIQTLPGLALSIVVESPEVDAPLPAPASGA